jgi:HEAT repeat protein
VRGWCAEALGAIGPDAASATPALIETIRNSAEVAAVRGDAAWALGKLGPGEHDADVIAALTDASHDANQQLRSRAVEALQRLPPAATP